MTIDENGVMSMPGGEEYYEGGADYYEGELPNCLICQQVPIYLRIPSYVTV